MHYSKHRLTASVTTWLRARTRQPMSNGLALLAHWSVCQKLLKNRITSVQLRRSVRAFAVVPMKQGCICCFSVTCVLWLNGGDELPYPSVVNNVNIPSMELWSPLGNRILSATESWTLAFIHINRYCRPSPATAVLLVF